MIFLVVIITSFKKIPFFLFFLLFNQIFKKCINFFLNWPSHNFWSQSCHHLRHLFAPFVDHPLICPTIGIVTQRQCSERRCNSLNPQLIQSNLCNFPRLRPWSALPNPRWLIGLVGPKGPRGGNGRTENLVVKWQAQNHQIGKNHRHHQPKEKTKRKKE